MFLSSNKVRPVVHADRRHGLGPESGLNQSSSFDISQSTRSKKLSLDSQATETYRFYSSESLVLARMTSQARFLYSKRSTSDSCIFVPSDISLIQQRKTKTRETFFESFIDETIAMAECRADHQVERNVSPSTATFGPLCCQKCIDFCAMFRNAYNWVVGKVRVVCLCGASVDMSNDDDTDPDSSWSVDVEPAPVSLKSEAVTLHLQKNPSFIYEFLVDKFPLANLERIYLYKIKLKYDRGSNEKISKPESIPGENDFTNILKALKPVPLESELVFELASNIRDVFEAQAFRLYKISPINHQEFLEIYAMEDTGAFPQPLVLKREGPCGCLLEVIERRKCMYFTRLNEPIILKNGSHALFKKNLTDKFAVPYMMLIPILEDDGEVSHVIEVWRSSCFVQAECNIAANFVVWGSLSMHFCRNMLEKNTDSIMSDFLLKTVKSVFEEIISLDQVIKHILHFIQKLVNADRASLFMVDLENQELVSSFFDLNLYGQASKEMLRIPIDRGIAGHVAMTGKSVNITNAYEDERFNREVDELTGYRTTSILCMPIKVMGRTIGVVQMVNKLNAPKFDCRNERSFQQFASFFGLVLRHAELYGQITRKEQMYRVALEVLSYHNTSRDSEVTKLISLEPHKLSFPLVDFYLDQFAVSTVQKCQATIIMFDDLFDIKKFDSTKLTRFILTVKRNYRDVPYHNFHHGWSVAQTMYSILRNDTSNNFSSMQRLALFIASLCHDLDHRGYTNKYMSETASPLAAMYSTSTLEHHHFNITVSILQQDGHNIFGHFTSEEYKEVLGLIKTSILATDLASFFPKLAELKVLCDSEKSLFNWDVTYHSELAMAISMTAADLSASAKPWDVQNKTVKVIFEEFYDQGDKERAAGREPISMMDRNKPEEQPASQVGFITQICMPCYMMLYKLLPGTAQLLQMATRNLEIWAAKAASVEKIRAETEKQLDMEAINLYSIPRDINQPGPSGMQRFNGNATEVTDRDLEDEDLTVITEAGHYGLERDESSKL